VVTGVLNKLPGQSMLIGLMLTELLLKAFSEYLAAYQQQSTGQTWSYADFCPNSVSRR